MIIPLTDGLFKFKVEYNTKNTLLMGPQQVLLIF